MSHDRWSGWFTSSYTNASGSCVEVNLGTRGVLVRDSKDRRDHQPELRISRQGWSAFLNDVAAPGARTVD
ncbi:DUF397 domain-containing protein [Lentzea sp. NPDC059081]|uniref:DUF397 domain-containing protein n=1 Tax=Lentzea sp. NPDC059081 TaxID=3346719 RepID=UPI0036861C32